MPKVQKGLFVSPVARKKTKDLFLKKFVIYSETIKLNEEKPKQATTAN